MVFWLLVTGGVPKVPSLRGRLSFFSWKMLYSSIWIKFVDSSILAIKGVKGQATNIERKHKKIRKEIQRNIKRKYY